MFGELHGHNFGLANERVVLQIHYLEHVLTPADVARCVDVHAALCFRLHVRELLLGHSEDLDSHKADHAIHEDSDILAVVGGRLLLGDILHVHAGDVAGEVKGLCG
ncbi:hypothetical protein N7448_011231 [Penicillium atrosanguineum]|nr:hypothetical protein N7448_011231 [Penicillium atrosanguineum]